MSFERIADNLGRVLQLVFTLVGVFIGMAVGFPLLAQFWPDAENGLNQLISMWNNSTLPYVTTVGKPLLELTPLFLAIVIPFAVIGLIVVMVRTRD